MAEYLGEFPLPEDHPCNSYTSTDWAMAFIESYGGIDGDHHKTWVLDQVARVLKGTEVKAVEARWANGEINLRYQTAEPSQEYLDWVDEMKGPWDSEEEMFEYDYDEGIAP